MIQFDKYSKWLKLSLYSILILLCGLSSCAKQETEGLDSSQNAMLFGIEEITQTRLSYSDQDNGGLAAKFDAYENIGLFAYYNNFYHYYNEYASFAESVLFSNQGLIIDANYNATYSPLKSWTFSTLYGTAPHTLDAVAYYPFEEDYNPGYINLFRDSENNTLLEYYYVGYLGSEVAQDSVVQCHRDFMTAHTRYDYSGTPSDFRDAMLELTSIPLTFTRQLASLNLQVTKPDDYPTEIIVTGISVYFDAYRKFTQSIDSKSTVTWSNMTSNYSLTATATCNTELEETGWDSTPDQDAYNTVENLLEDDNMLFFPPETQINKVVFTLTDDGAETTYTWHPHIATIEANTHYTLSLELDPARAN